jgi:hypothetical protein
MLRLSSMLLYKYKSLSKLDHVLDILLCQRLYCAPYQELNDPFEGQFYSRFSVPVWFRAGTAVGSPLQKWKEPKSIDDLMSETKKKNICSLSSSPTDVRLWSLYAEGHTGVAIEMNFKGVESSVHKVKYVDSLPEFGDTLLVGPTPEDILSCKTWHWEYEQEFRIIGKEAYHSVESRITRILVGHRAPHHLLEILTKVVPASIQVKRVTLDHEGANVRV